MKGDKYCQTIHKKAMLISVIIVAYNRKKYLVKALNSILNQGVGRDNYEIIVVKNFKDEKIDSFIESIDAKNIFTQEITLGAKLKIGIEASKGEVLTFLEDDDLFFVGKLEFLIEKFRKQDLGFIHNEYFYINEKGEEIKLGNKYKLKSPISKKGADDIYSFLRKSIRAQGFFNLSCISVKKSILTAKSLVLLKGMQIAADNFMFYVACDSKMDVLITNETYTGYRVHNENASFYIERKLPTFIRKKIKFFTSNILGYDLIDNIINDPEIKLFLTSRKHMSYLAYDILTKGEMPTKYKVTFFQFCKSCSITRSWELSALFITLKFSRLFPNLAKQIYFLYEKMKFTP